jgi:two-component system, NtrC family, response regulator AtoC
MTQLNAGITDDLLFGSSDWMQQLRGQVDHIAATCLPVLIEGESGTGKEALARAIHARSPRHRNRFVKISCSAATLHLPLERLICGDEPDASTAGMTREHAGTILFDDIGELDPSLQPKVITLLQNDRISETGAGGVQVICTTRQSLRPKLESGSFRADLYYRINVVNLYMPALRERRVDIPELAFHFLRLYTEAYQRSSHPFSQSLLELFVAADWPGNIRELENLVKRYIILGTAEPIINDLRKQANRTLLMEGAPGEVSLKTLTRSVVRDCECKVILTSLNRNEWNRQKTARELHISYRSLLYRMRQLGLRRRYSPLNEECRAGPSAE